MAPLCAMDAVGCTEEAALDRSRRPGGLVQRRQTGNMASGLKRLRKRRSCSETFCGSARIIARLSGHQGSEPCDRGSAPLVGGGHGTNHYDILYGLPKYPAKLRPPSA